MKEFTYVIQRTVIQSAEVIVRAKDEDEAVELVAYQNTEWEHIETVNSEMWLESEEDVDEDVGK